MKHPYLDVYGSTGGLTAEIPFEWRGLFGVTPSELCYNHAKIRIILQAVLQASMIKYRGDPKITIPDQINVFQP
jgi:hypothetical protein